MHAGLFDVFHDPADHHHLAVGQSVHVHFRGFLEELIDQHRTRGTHQRRLRHVILHRLQIVGDDHGAPAQNVAGPHQHRQTDLLGNANGLLGNQRRSVVRLRNRQLIQEPPKSPPVFRQIDRLRRRADDRHAVALQVERQIQRRLPAKLHDDALRLLALDHRQNVFERQRLEVQPVGGVVIGRDRLRVAVHHDRLESVFAQRKRSVAAAIVELDSLPDAVRAAAQDDDLGSVGGGRLVFVLVRRIQIRRKRFKLGRAGIHPLEDGRDVRFGPLVAHGRRRGFPHLRQLLVACAGPLGLQQKFRRHGLHRDRGQRAC